MSQVYFVQMYHATTSRQQFQQLTSISLIIALPSTFVKAFKEMATAMRFCFHEFWIDLSKYRTYLSLVSYS